MRPSGQVSGLKGLFDGNREARLVRPGDSYKVSVSILGRHPPPKHHTAWAPDSEPVTIPRRLRGVGGQGTVGTVGGDEVL